MDLEQAPSFDHDVVELDGDSAIRIRPNTPLDPLKRYVVVVTNEVTANGNPVSQSPTYARISDESQDLGVDALEPVRSLVNGLWENIATNYFGLTNIGRGDNPLDASNVAMSYSFTTSEDAKVLSHIAQPTNWFEDQLTRQVTSGEAILRVNLQRLFFANRDEDEKSGVDPEFFGFEVDDEDEDDKVSDAELTAAALTAIGKDPATDEIELADFLRPTANSEPRAMEFADVAYFVGEAKEDFEAADVDDDFAGCDDSPSFEGKVSCVASGGKDQLVASGVQFPEPAGQPFSIDSTDDILNISSLLSSSNLSIDAGTVDLHQGSITLPYFLGVPDATQTDPTSVIRTQSWRPDSALAGFIGDALDTEIPQSDTDVSRVLNYNFPFPEHQEDVQVPMLVMTPEGMDPTNDSDVLTPVIFQHCITSDRSAALAFGSQLIADAAEEGENLAVFAIDQPLHGVSPFTKEEKEDLATRLLVNAGRISEDEDGEPEIDDDGQDLIDTVVEGRFPPQVVTAIALGLQEDFEPGCEEARFNGMPDGEGGTVSGERPFEDAVGNVLISNNNCGALAQGSLQNALTLDNTVSNAGSQIPGLEPQNTGTGFADGLVNERHFGFTVGADNNPVPMSFDDGFGDSGSLFINLTNFMNNRDNLRQGSIDLMNLSKTINDMDGIDNGNGIAFIGHSLGTLNGGAFVGAVDSVDDIDISAAHMLTPVAGTIRLLENSPSFAPTILGGLRDVAGINQGDASLETYLNVNQAALDAVEPLNFTTGLGATNTLLSQINGDRTTPNAAVNDPSERFGGDASTVGVTPLSIDFPDGLRIRSFEAPLSGSEALAKVLGDDGEILRFANGVHGTPVFPREEEAEEGDVLKDRSFAAGGEILVSDDDASETFEAMIEGTLIQLGINPNP